MGALPKRRWATFLIRLPFPFYLTAKEAGTLMAARFNSPAMSLAEESQRDRWEYYAGFVTVHHGYWLANGNMGRYRFQKRELPTLVWGFWRDTPDVLIGRLSLWDACRHLDRLGGTPVRRRTSPLYYLRAAWAKAMVRLFAPRRVAATPAYPPLPSPHIPPPPPEDLDAPRTELEANTEPSRKPRKLKRRAGTKTPVETLDLALKPDDVQYNWKTDDPANQAFYKKNGWRPVPADRHPELADIAKDGELIWENLLLMECPVDLYDEMVKEDLDLAERQIIREHHPTLESFQVFDFVSGKKRHRDARD